MVLTNNPRTLIQLVAQSLVPGFSPTATQIAAHTQTANQSSLMRLGPSTVAALINASTLALLNTSSVPLKGVVCAAAVGRVRDASGVGVLVVDPSKDELKILDGAGVFAFLITGGHPSAGLDLLEQEVDEAELRADLVWSSWSVMPYDEEEAERAQTLARIAALRVRAHMKRAIARVVHGVHGRKAVEGNSKLKQPEHEPSINVSQDDDKMEIS